MRHQRFAQRTGPLAQQQRDLISADTFLGQQAGQLCLDHSQFGALLHQAQVVDDAASYPCVQNVQPIFQGCDVLTR